MSVGGRDLINPVLVTATAEDDPPSIPYAPSSVGMLRSSVYRAFHAGINVREYTWIVRWGSHPSSNQTEIAVPDCELTRLAEHPRAADPFVSQHLTCCSPCFNRYMKLLAHLKRRNAG